MYQRPGDLQRDLRSKAEMEHPTPCSRFHTDLRGIVQAHASWEIFFGEAWTHKEKGQAV